MSAAPPKTKTTYTFTLLCLFYFLLNAPSNMIAPNLSRIADEFNLTNYQRDTILGGGLSFFYNIASFFVSLCIGFYSGKLDRKTIYTALILVSQLGCISTIFVTDLVGLFITRTLTGIGYGAVSQFRIIYIADVFTD